MITVIIIKYFTKKNFSPPATKKMKKEKKKVIQRRKHVILTFSDTICALFIKLLTFGLNCELYNPLDDWLESINPTNHPADYKIRGLTGELKKFVNNALCLFNLVILTAYLLGRRYMGRKLDLLKKLNCPNLLHEFTYIKNKKLQKLIKSDFRAE